METKSFFLLILFGADPSTAASLAVNFSHGDFPNSTGIQTSENTNALNSIAGLANPSWNNLAIVGAGAAANGRNSAIFNGIGVSVFSSNSWLAGSEGIFSGDASQQVFRIFLDDGEDGNTYFAGDGIGPSIHLRGLGQYMTANNASSYTLTLFSRLTQIIMIFEMPQSDQAFRAHLVQQPLLA